MSKIRLYANFIKWSILQGWYQAKYERFGNEADHLRALTYDRLTNEMMGMM